MFSYGTLTPATYMEFGSSPSIKTTFKMYTCYPTQGVSTAIPRLYTSIDGGLTWTDETTAADTSFGSVHYGGNFIFDARLNKLQALGHRSRVNGRLSDVAYCTPSLTSETWIKTGNGRAQSAVVADKDVITTPGDYFKGRQNTNNYVLSITN